MPTLVKRWAKLSDWEPNSSRQVIAYLRSKGYPVPKHRKTKKPTADEDSLERIIRKHPEDEVLPRVLTARRLSKGAGYFNENYIGRDGRLHPEYTRHPETLRPSSRAPNLFNIPQGRGPNKEEKLVAKLIRDTIIASPGYTLIERDYKAQESLLVGWFAGDEQYMRMARLGIYTFFLADSLGKPVDFSLSNSEIKAHLTPIKAAYPFEYALWKVIILAKGYGEQDFALAKQLEPFFWEAAKKEAEEKGKPLSWAARLMADMGKDSAKRYSAIYEKLAPKVVKWQYDTRLRAHKERKLTNPFGYCRTYMDVFTKSNGTWALGSEANKVLAFLPQSTGAGILTEACLELDAQTINDPDLYPLIPLYDSITAEARIDKAAHYQTLLKGIMEAPIAALGGLTIETEGKIGASWGSMVDCA